MSQPLAAPLSATRLALLNFAVFMPIGVQLPFFALWLAAIGFRPDTIALVLGTTPLIRFAANLIVPPRADRTGDPGGLLLHLSIITALALLATGMVGGFWPIFACIIVSAFAQGPIIALTDSLVLREARRRALSAEQGMDYSRIRSVGSIAVLIVMVTGGFVASLVPSPALIWIIAGTCTATALMVWLCLPARRGIASPTSATRSRAPLLRPRLVILTIVAMALIQSSHALVYTFGAIDWRAQGYGDATIGLLWAAGVATEVLFFVFATKRFGGADSALMFLLTGGIISILRWVLTAINPDTIGLFAVQALHAGTFAATHLGAVLAMATFAGEHRRAQAQGWISAANAVSIAAATMATGPLWTTFGLHAYYAMAAMAACGTALAIVAIIASRR